MKAVIYCCVSPDSQELNGTSLQTQIEAMTEMKDKFDWEQRDNGELYIRCKHCGSLYVWKPYKPKHLKGKAVKGVGEFCYLSDLYHETCQDCRSLITMWCLIHDATWQQIQDDQWEIEHMDEDDAK